MSGPERKREDGREAEALAVVSYTEPSAVLKLYFEEHFKIITLFSFKTEVNFNAGSGTSFAIGLIKNLYWGESDALAS